MTTGRFENRRSVTGSVFEPALCDLDHDGGFTGVVDSGAMAKILIVEDNEMNRDMLSRRLERRGYVVVMAVDGAEGVAMSEVELPDIVLMDMSLPILNGWEATRAIKADALTAHIPVIALTAHSMPGDREKAMESGCDDYDTKPVDLPRLLSKMAALGVEA